MPIKNLKFSNSAGILRVIPFTNFERITNKRDGGRTTYKALQRIKLRE